ncbi:MAG: hypothetical protein A2Y10_19740 [Planctomycetes bacterium GWF2_41_51]|nr:MAG: hypothetical protein A2Y10_19740 [Planctomycetes bacterium GWF2_41_51]HBG28212.1 dinitrogenase iron-molybdenum cofactor biosynthesis protein [Phycisphaerales bacterium]
MKILITAAAPVLSAKVDEHFGRAAYFIIADTETDGFEAIENDNANALTGAGIASAQKVIKIKPEIVLTGSCGPKAEQLLTAANIKIRTGIKGTVEDALKSAGENC